MSKLKDRVTEVQIHGKVYSVIVKRRRAVRSALEVLNLSLTPEEWVGMNLPYEQMLPVFQKIAIDEGVAFFERAPVTSEVSYVLRMPMSGKFLFVYEHSQRSLDQPVDYIPKLT